MRNFLPPAVTFVVVLLVLEFSTKLFGIPRFLLPPPTTVLRTLLKDRVELGGAFLQTGLSAGVGFGISAAVGFTAAVLLSSAGWIQRALYPYAVFFQTVPVIAIAPLLVIWLGYGTPTVVASASIVSVFPVIANTLSGLLATEPALLDLFRLYGAGRWATLTKLRIPSAVPTILTGLEIAAGLAVIGAIVGEFIAGTGLGSVIDSARTQQRTDKVFAAVFLASLLGAGLVGSISLARRIALLRWHGTSPAGILSRT
jgi:NitT/TauT family transport system permease protein